MFKWHLTIKQRCSTSTPDTWSIQQSKNYNQKQQLWSQIYIWREKKKRIRDVPIITVTQGVLRDDVQGDILSPPPKKLYTNMTKTDALTHNNSNWQTNWKEGRQWNTLGNANILWRVLEHQKQNKHPRKNSLEVLFHHYTLKSHKSTG